MPSLKIGRFLLLVNAWLLIVTACNFKPEMVGKPPPTAASYNTPTLALETPTETPAPPRLLTVCMGQEPASLFLYADGSEAARTIREAIYDGPYDVRGFDLIPVIMESKPTQAGDDVLVEAQTVQAGTVIADINGNLASLEDGVSYYPAGCTDAACAAVYAGGEPVQMDQLVVHFKLLQDVRWSDGTPLTADDSVYAFQLAKALYPQVRAELIAYTQSYRALDSVTVEWRGLPGYSTSGYATHFFMPLPRHAWGSLMPEELLSADISNRAPLGWGPYVIEEWASGDHISLRRNENYFRSAEGLPVFNRLVYRFVPTRQDAIAALLAGECDYLDETVRLETESTQLLQLAQSGQVSVVTQVGTAWEHADFGIAPIDQAQPSLFLAKETRQAIATCIDRQRMADELFFGQSQVQDSYVPAAHPLYNPDVHKYAYDPQVAAGLLDTVGWLDTDADPATPRISQAVPGVPDGTPFEFTFLTTDEAEKLQAAQILQESLAACGIKVNVESMPWDALFAPGPDGPLFGRKFALAQFGWASAYEPPCYLYTSEQIPGPYPAYSHGWGGANASGYSNADYDRLCQQALSTLPEMPAYAAAHAQAQTIFAEDLPAVPLYARLKLVATRPDLCGVEMDASALSSLWNVERFDYGDGCNTNR